MSADSLRDYISGLPDEAKAAAKQAVLNWAYKQDYTLYAERVLLADEFGNPGRLSGWQKKLVGMPLGASAIAVTGRQL